MGREGSLIEKREPEEDKGTSEPPPPPRRTRRPTPHLNAKRLASTLVSHSILYRVKSRGVQGGRRKKRSREVGRGRKEVREEGGSEVEMRDDGMGYLEDRALVFLLGDGWLEGRNDRLIEDVLQLRRDQTPSAPILLPRHLKRTQTHPLLRQCRALDILDSPKLARETLSRLRRHGPLLLPGELLEHGRVVAEIDLGTDDEARDTGAVVVDLREKGRGEG